MNRYAALLRGINVGGKRRVEMKRLKLLFEAAGFVHVSTYLNSGNVLFESEKTDTGDLRALVEGGLAEEFGFGVPTLIIPCEEMRRIAGAVPPEWQNDREAKTDVAYLFPEIDREELIAELPVKREHLDIRYVPGAVFWRIDRRVLNKSQLSRLAGHKLYQLMTIRNINTARRLALP